MAHRTRGEMVEDFQDGAAGLPAELWAVVMSKLYNEAPFVGLRPEDAGYGGAGDLACSMRVNSEWYGTASLILYNRVTTTDILQLLHGVGGESVRGLRTKSDLCALIKHLRIVKTPVPSSTGATDVSAVSADVERLTELRDIRALNVALGPEWDAPADIDATGLDVESVRAIDPLSLASEQPDATLARLPSGGPFPALHSLELQYYKANRPMFVRDRFSGLNAIQLLSPDHVCLHYDGDESARDVPIADPRRDASRPQDLTLHIDRIATRGFFYLQQNQFPLLQTGQTRWIINCHDIEGSPGAGQQSEADLDRMRVPYVCFIGRFLATTLHRSPTPWTRLHIDFVLPSLESPVGDKFVEEVGGCAALVHAEFVEWLSRLHPDTGVVEDKYRLTWAFVEKVVCEGCKGVTAGQQGAA